MQINENFLNLKGSYLFSIVAKKVADFKERNPGKKVISLGIGDVTLPLAPAVISAMRVATDEMAQRKTFRGYGPEQGHLFLREKIKSYYAKRDVRIHEDEIFVSDGAKSDIGNFLDISGASNVVCISDPVYPVYVDTNIMAGHKIVYARANVENGFLPFPDESITCDIIYICSPNNPTGAVYDKVGLKKWVDYANERGAVILFDAAYEAFVSDLDIPRSIFEIDGAKTCAIEFCSFSKLAGFTGMRCGYTIIPSELKRGGISLRDLWFRRQSTKFNGVSYVVQRAAEAAISEPGFSQSMENVAYYMENAKIIAQTLKKMGVWFVGGVNSPYVWLRCPQNMSSWDFFDQLLERANIIGTPGSGFGREGEGFFRFTSFGLRKDTLEAMYRFAEMF
jgi:LL-diaminopimelate aminotransferase